MSWNLFLDDERELSDVTWAPWQIREKYRNETWVVCRSYGDAMIEILNRGFQSLLVLIMILAMGSTLATNSRSNSSRTTSSLATKSLVVSTSLSTTSTTTFTRKTLLARQTSKAC